MNIQTNYFVSREGGAHLTRSHIDTSIFLLIHFGEFLPFYVFFTQMELPDTR